MKIIYLSSFKLSENKVRNPNIYPYNVFARKDALPLSFRQSLFYMEIMVRKINTFKYNSKQAEFERAGICRQQSVWGVLVTAVNLLGNAVTAWGR